jgi:hypothetical protein
VRTWAPKGQTPVIQFHFNWNHVSVIAGLTRTNCMFRLHEGSIKKEEVVDFLKALKAHLKQPLLVIWDGLKAHRSFLVRDYLDTLNGHTQIAFLPPHAPDLNPVEYSVGLAQATRAGQLLSQRPGRVARHCTQQTQERSKASFYHRRLLDAGYALVMSGIMQNSIAPGVPSRLSLEDQGRGISSLQAARFASLWRVVEQYDHWSDPYPVYDEAGGLISFVTTTNGLSATVFEEVASGRRFLSIRGTDDRYDLATDAVSAVLLGTTHFQKQYQALRLKVQESLANGTVAR